MKKTHEAMHRSVGKAVTELRRTRNWSQSELAHQIARHGRCGRSMQAPTVGMISEWEHGLRAPAPEYRAALARIAKKDKSTEDLVPLFLASMTAWHVVSRVELLHGRQEPLRERPPETKGTST